MLKDRSEKSEDGERVQRLKEIVLYHICESGFVIPRDQTGSCMMTMAVPGRVASQYSGFENGSLARARATELAI